MVKKTVQTVTHSLLSRVNSGEWKKVIALASLLGAVATINTFLGDPIGSYISKLIDTRISGFEQTIATHTNSLFLLRKDVDANTQSEADIKDQLKIWRQEDAIFKEKLYTRLGDIEGQLKRIK